MTCAYFHRFKIPTSKARSTIAPREYCVVRSSRQLYIFRIFHWTYNIPLKFYMLHLGPLVAHIAVFIAYIM